MGKIIENITQTRILFENNKLAFRSQISLLTSGRQNVKPLTEIVVQTIRYPTMLQMQEDID